VEIPDAAVWHIADRLASVTWLSPKRRAEVARELLEAARPYLMPGREEIAKAIDSHYEEDEYRSEYNEAGECVGSAAADAVLALLNGEIKKGEDQ
jgi:hypothetical protein